MQKHCCSQFCARRTVHSYNSKKNNYCISPLLISPSRHSCWTASNEWDSSSQLFDCYIFLWCLFMTGGDLSCFNLGEPPRWTSQLHPALSLSGSFQARVHRWCRKEIYSKNTYRSGKQAAQVTRAGWLTGLKVKLTQPSQPSLLWE